MLLSSAVSWPAPTSRVCCGHHWTSGQRPVGRLGGDRGQSGHLVPQPQPPPAAPGTGRALPLPSVCPAEVRGAATALGCDDHRGCRPLGRGARWAGRCSSYPVDRYLVGLGERRESSRSSLRRQTAGRGYRLDTGRRVPGCDSPEGREERRPTASSRNQGGKEPTLPCSRCCESAALQAACPRLDMQGAPWKVFVVTNTFAPRNQLHVSLGFQPGLQKPP